MLHKKSRVDVHSKLTIVSGKPTGPGKTHPFSPLDHSMGLHTIHLVFYYSKNPGGSSDLNHLRLSLCDMLSHYPPVTGRLTRDGVGNWKVRCNDAGVRVYKAKVSVTVDEWLRSADEAEERDLTVWEDMPEDVNIWSPFRVQISDFEGGGLAIGLSCTHLHTDPTGALLLFQSWTQVLKGQPISHQPLYHASIFQGSPIISPNLNTKSIKYYASKSKTEPSNPVKMATATFRFSETMIKQWLSNIHGKCPSATPFDVLASLFWIRITQSKSPSLDKSHIDHLLSICIDTRQLLDAPLSYFGNAQYFSRLAVEGDELVKSDALGHVAGLINHHVSSIGKEEVKTVIDWFESRKDETGKYAPPFRMYGPELTCISMEHLTDSSSSIIYRSMFEQGVKPLHVSCHFGNVEGEGMILIMPSPEGGSSRTVTVTLPDDQVMKLCADDEILSLKPELVVSGR